MFTQHTIVDLKSGITFIVRLGEAFTVKLNKHTHTHAHTHTHTHTHTERHSPSYTPFNNNRKIPETQSYITNKLPSVKFQGTDISNIIRSLDVNKARGHDDIPIRMLKIYDSTIVEALSIIINSCINQSMFSDIWKESNICPIHKKVN